MAALSEAAGGATRGGAGDADAGADAGGPKAAVCEASTQTPPSYKGGLHRVILATCAATLCNVAFGYDVGVVSGSLNAMAQSLDLTTIEKEVATSGLNFLAGLGAIGVSGLMLDRIGRINTLLVAAMLLIAGSAVVASAYSFPQLVVGRALQGLGSGSSWVACSVYITEIAPSKYRGALVSLADVSINVGILLGYGIDHVVRIQTQPDSNLHWRLSMALSVVWPLLYICLYPCLYDSPRHLASKGHDDQALKAIEAITIPGDPAPEEQLQAIKKSLLGTKELSWSECLCPDSAAHRKIVIVALLLGVTQQLTGTEAVLYYLPQVLSHLSEYWAFIGNLGVGTAKLTGELVAAALVEFTGRRVLMIGGNILLCASIVGLGLAFQFQETYTNSTGSVVPTDESNIIQIALLCSIMFTFSLGPGPFTLVVINEMTPLLMRGRVVATAVLMNRLGSGTIALTFLSLSDTIEVWNTFYLYGALAFAITVFYYFVVPESTGMTLEDVESAGKSAADIEEEEGLQQRLLDREDTSQVCEA